MADNLETSEIIVQDEQGNNQLVQAVANQEGTMVWDEGMKTALCVVQTANGKQLALKTFSLGGNGGGITEDNIIIKSKTIPTASADNLGKMYIYAGETNDNFTHGYIYENQHFATYSGTISFTPAEIIVSDENFSNFLNRWKLYLTTPTLVTNGTITYHGSSSLWKMVMKNANDQQIGTLQLYQSDYEDSGFNFPANPQDGDSYTFTTSITESSSSYQWVRIDVQGPAIVKDTTSTSITLAEAKGNTIYKYGTLTSLTITANETSDQETVIYFTAGATITATLPNTLKWINDNTFTPEANTDYVISIVNNIAAWAAYN